MNPRVLLLPALLLLGACSYLQGSAAPYRPAGGIVSPGEASGMQLYQRDCAWCHGNRGQGTPNGPTLLLGTNGAALTDFMLSTGRMPVTQPSQKDALHRNSAYPPEDIAAITAYVQALGQPGPEVPVVDLSRGSLTDGLHLYQANCAACHSTTGEGGAIATGKPGVINGFVLTTKGLVAPPLFKATSTQIAEAMRTGPPGMPVFGPSAFPDDQVDSIARYVLALQESNSPGGFALGRIGPVAEGAVGWLVGLAILILFTRWIGTGLPRPGHHGGDHFEPHDEGHP